MERYCNKCGCFEDEVYGCEIDFDWYCYKCVGNLERCDYCNQFITGDTFNVQGKDICGHCYFTRTVSCEHCGERIFELDALEADDNYYCEDCYEVVKNVYEYHEFNDWSYFTMPGDDDNLKWNDNLSGMFIGAELEVEFDSKDKIFECIPELLNERSERQIVLEKDGSLDCGIEIISHPMSIAYLKQRGGFREIMGICEYYSGKSHDTSTCGLHFHINRSFLEISTTLSEDEVIDNILLLMETFKEELTIFSRRTKDELKEYAKFGNIKNTCRLTKSIIKKNKKEYKESRYNMLNLRNRDTIEFRIFKGTLRYETFLACVELVSNIVTLCKREKIDGLTWEDVVNHNIDKNEYLLDYVLDREIISTKAITKPHSRENIIYKFANKQCMVYVDDLDNKELANEDDDLCYITMDNLLKEVSQILKRKISRQQYEHYRGKIMFIDDSTCYIGLTYELPDGMEVFNLSEVRKEEVSQCV